MSSSFTNQVLAQLDLHFSATGKPTLSGTNYDANRVYILPKKLDEEVARLHLGKLGVKLTTLTKEQADYIGVPVEGPYKSAHLPSATGKPTLRARTTMRVALHPPKKLDEDVARLHLAKLGGQIDDAFEGTGRLYWRRRVRAPTSRAALPLLNAIARLSGRATSERGGGGT